VSRRDRDRPREFEGIVVAPEGAEAVMNFRHRRKAVVEMLIEASRVCAALDQGLKLLLAVHPMRNSETSAALYGTS